jgi:hypothetical protein
VKAQAKVFVEEEDGDTVALVIWPDPVFHERYGIFVPSGDVWMQIAHGWRGQFVQPEPTWIDPPRPASEWIEEKIKEARS